MQAAGSATSFLWLSSFPNGFFHHFVCILPKGDELLFVSLKDELQAVDLSAWLVRVRVMLESKMVANQMDIRRLPELAADCYRLAADPAHWC